MNTRWFTYLVLSGLIKILSISVLFCDEIEPQQSTDKGQIIAKVNGVPLFEKVVYGIRLPYGTKEEVERYKENALQRAIKHELLYQEAKKQGLDKDQSYKKLLKKMEKERQESEIEYLARLFMNLDEGLQKIIYQHHSVSDVEVADYYEEHKDEFSNIPEEHAKSNIRDMLSDEKWVETYTLYMKNIFLRTEVKINEKVLPVDVLVTAMKNYPIPYSSSRRHAKEPQEVLFPKVVELAGGKEAKSNDESLKLMRDAIVTIESSSFRLGDCDLDRILSPLSKRSVGPPEFNRDSDLLLELWSHILAEETKRLGLDKDSRVEKFMIPPEERALHTHQDEERVCLVTHFMFELAIKGLDVNVYVDSIWKSAEIEITESIKTEEIKPFNEEETDKTRPKSAEDISYWEPAWFDNKHIIYTKHIIHTKQVEIVKFHYGILSDLSNMPSELLRIDYYVCVTDLEGKGEKVLKQFSVIDPNSMCKAFMIAEGKEVPLDTQQIPSDYNCSNEWIVFKAASTIGKWGYPGPIYIMKPDGSQIRKLVDNGNNPRLSPDNKQILYGDSERKALWLINIDGTGNRKLVEPGSNGIWSPDGKKIAYWVDYRIYEGPSLDKEWGSYIIDIDGKNRMELDRHGSAPVDWTPDGKRILIDGGGFINVFTGEKEFLNGATNQWESFKNYKVNISEISKVKRDKIAKYSVGNYPWTLPESEVAIRIGLDYERLSPDGKRLVGDPKVDIAVAKSSKYDSSIGIQELGKDKELTVLRIN